MNELRVDLYGAWAVEVALHRRLIKEWIEWLVNEEGEGTTEYWLGELREDLGMSWAEHARLGRVLMAEWWVNRLENGEQME